MQQTKVSRQSVCHELLLRAQGKGTTKVGGLRRIRRARELKVEACPAAEIRARSRSRKRSVRASVT
eukprot:960632-Prorocentrum_lima.AAC.1